MPSDLVIATILSEAAGEGEEGMYAVASVIANRSQRRKKTPVQVVDEPYQFSGRWRKDLDAFVARQPKQAVEMATRAWARAQLEPMPKVDHYYKQGTDEPSWAPTMRSMGRVGKHLLFDSSQLPEARMPGQQSTGDPLEQGLRYMNRMAQALGLGPLKAQEIAQIMAQVEPPTAITTAGKRNVSGVRLRATLPAERAALPMADGAERVTPALNLGGMA